MNTHTTLPREAARILIELEARHVIIRVQQKLNESGCWQPELQATGAIFGNDWQRLRRYHGPIVRHLQEIGETDDPFCEISLPERLKLGADLTKSALESERRVAKIKISDERALRSREEARRAVKEEKDEQDSRTRWTDGQTRYLQKSYFNDAVWPHHALAKAEAARRKVLVIEQLATLGQEWNWRQIRHRLRHLQLCGRLEKKSDKA